MERNGLAALVDEGMEFNAATIAAAKGLARSKPWQGTFDERMEKFKAFVDYGRWMAASCRSGSLACDS